jgi:DNA-binding transcriptional LysR family regulator
MITYPNLYHLKYFVDAVALGSISGSAQKNLVTHPAISRSISALEKHLGTPLLEHQKKSFKLTEAGYKVAAQAQILLSAASQFQTLSLDSDKNESVELKIGVSRTLSELYLNPLLLNLKADFPNATAKVRFGTTNEIVEAVANRSIDLGLTIGTLNLATLRQTAIKKGQFILVESGPKKYWSNQFESKPFILTEPRSETEKLKAAYKRQFSRSLPVLFEISSWEVIGQLIQKGLGIGLLPDISVKNWNKGSYRILESLDFECPYEIYIHTLKSSGNNRAVEYIKNSLGG